MNDTLKWILIGAFVLIALPMLATIGGFFDGAQDGTKFLQLSSTTLQPNQPLTISFISADVPIPHLDTIIACGTTCDVAAQNQIAKYLGAVRTDNMEILLDGNQLATPAFPICANDGSFNNLGVVCSKVYSSGSYSIYHQNTQIDPTFYPRGDVIAQTTLNQHFSNGHHTLKIYWQGANGVSSSSPLYDYVFYYGSASFLLPEKYVATYDILINGTTDTTTPPTPSPAPILTPPQTPPTSPIQPQSDMFATLSAPMLLLLIVAGGYVLFLRKR